MNTVAEHEVLREAFSKLTLGSPKRFKGLGACRFSGSTPPIPPG